MTISTSQERRYSVISEISVVFRFQQNLEVNPVGL